MKQKKEKNKKYYQGFSIIELLVTMFVFVLIMLVVTSVFAVMVKTRKEAREMQRNMENVRTAMDFMAKNIRMGSVDGMNSGETSNEIYFYNHSQQKCMYFEFNSGNNNIYFGEISGARDGLTDCSILSYASKELASFGDYRSIKDIGFYFVRFGTSSTLGKVTISVGMEKAEENIQTTVSLRNYSLISGV